MTVSVVVRELEKYASGNVLGIIYLEENGEAFPGRGYSDFVLRVLAWWLSELFEASQMDESRLDFQDDPYFLYLRRYEQDWWHLEGCRYSVSSTQHVVEWNVNIEQLRDAVAFAAREVIEECDQQGWHDARDLAELKEELNRY